METIILHVNTTHDSKMIMTTHIMNINVFKLNGVSDVITLTQSGTNGKGMRHRKPINCVRGWFHATST